MKKLLSPDLNQAKHFLSLFNYTLVTFQFLKKSKPAGSYVANYPLQQKDWEHLISQHAEGKEIFFMVNEGDGETKPNKKIPRSQENVTRLTSLFIDTDNCPISEVKVFLKALKMKPHLVVETSPNKYHLYFLLDTTQPPDRHSSNFQTACKNWKYCQHVLSHLGERIARTDSSVKDKSRVLRVPGFFHLKNPLKPHLTRIVKEYTHPHYSLDETLRLFGHQTETPQSPDTEHTLYPHSTQYQLPDGKVMPGNRHHQIASMTGHLLNRGLDPQVARYAIYEMIRNHFHEPKRFLPGGDRHHEIDAMIDFKVNDIEQKELSERQKTISGINAEDDHSDLELPDSFYEQAPGITGEITREILQTSFYPLPSFAFASAVTLLSIIKGKSIKAEDGTPPTNYFLCLAPTGAGKSYAKDTIKHTLHKLNKSHLLESKVRSDRGVLQWLNRNSGIGALYMDEAEELLRSMEATHSPQHIRNFKTMLLELYSAYNDPHLSFGEIASKKEDAIVLNCPHLSAIIMGTPNIIDSAFTRKSVTDGLFQRFNVVYTKQKRVFNDSSAPAHSLNGNVFSQLNDIIRKTALAVEDGSTTIKISMGAAALRDEATAHYNALYNEEIKKDTQLEGIYTRAVEKALRLSVAMTEGDTLTPEVLSYALDYIEKNTEAMKSIAAESFIQSQVSKDMKDLQRFVAKNSNKQGWCIYRNIIRNFRIRDARQLKDTLQNCLDAEMLVEKTITSTRKGGRPGKAYAVGKL